VQKFVAFERLALCIARQQEETALLSICIQSSRESKSLPEAKELARFKTLFHHLLWFINTQLPN
jgi:hypothetical protein